MKNIKYLLSGLFIASFVVISCDVLDEEIVSGIDHEFYEGERGIHAIIDAAYAPLRTLYGGRPGVYMNIFGTDEYTHGGHGNFRYMNRYSAQLNSEAAPIWSLWSNFYEGINICNTAVNRIGKIEGDLSENEKNIMLGEARYLRAHYYFTLVQHFGPIHLTLEETEGVEIEANRTSEDIIYEAIIEDLEFAIQQLPVIQSQFGKATRPAAEHMLSLVLLTRGYTDFSEPNDFEIAADLAIDVINNYHHRLLESPIDVFDHDNEDNDEVIWSVQYTEELIANDQGNGNHMHFGAWFSFYDGLDDSNEPGYGRPWIRFRPTPFGLENFRPLDVDARYELTFQDVWYYNAPASIPEGSAVGDTAIWVTHEELSFEDVNEIKDRHPNIILYSWNLNNMDDDWYRPINMFPWPEAKFSDYKRPGPWTPEGSRNHIVYRLAETYLNAAEALLQEGREEDAVDYINAVRRRAAHPGMEGEIEITSAEVNIDFILDERARELFGEHKRWHDLKRTGKLLERVRLHNPEASDNIQDYHLLRPIPANQIIRTENEYEQNPGY